MKNIKKILKNKYWKEEMSTIEIAKDMGMSKGWVLKKMNKFGIKRRNQSEAGILRQQKTNFDVWE